MLIMKTHRQIGRGLAQSSLVASALFVGTAFGYDSYDNVKVSNPSQAISRGLSNSAQLSIAGSAFIIVGSVATVLVAGNFVVTALRPVGEASVLVLKSVGEGVEHVVEVSVRLIASALRTAGVAIGTAITFVAGTAGVAVRAEDKTIGYIVNETGRELLRQEQLQQLQKEKM